MSKVWFITGAGRGMGTDIAKAALNAGYKVVALTHCDNGNQPRKLSFILRNPAIARAIFINGYGIDAQR